MSIHLFTTPPPQPVPAANIMDNHFEAKQGIYSLQLLLFPQTSRQSFSRLALSVSDCSKYCASGASLLHIDSFLAEWLGQSDKRHCIRKANSSCSLQTPSAIYLPRIWQQPVCHQWCFLRGLLGFAKHLPLRHLTPQHLWTQTCFSCLLWRQTTGTVSSTKSNSF